MKTARTKIDVYAGTLSMEFGDITVHFNILDAMKHPSKDLFVFRVEIIDHVVDEYMIDLHSNLHACQSSCNESEFLLDHMSKFDVESESEFDIDYMSGDVLPLEIDFIKSVELTMFQEVHIFLTFFMRYRLRNHLFLPLSSRPHQN